ncbi:DUF2087 domain-containing protein [Paenibacillus sp. S3N08]|uniref:DUF2087 domain-containing protein n=2 Tax=Paenibacillus agricola TaxID=2716264 RepID=A0ABX0JBS1_9BACL|nr:DUF2087 domain-containing protein [Paenibacillus agricola]NHN33950.1 DUF2087 domain-containing protein [Paenibacillus agricola]
MLDAELLWKVPLEELKLGYTFDKSTAAFVCLACGSSFTKGVIYKEAEVYYEAEKFTTIHITREHGSMFEYLLGLGKRQTGLSDLQKNLLQLFYEGVNDNEIVDKLDGGSTSTIRNHRFALREKEKQAKLFLAIMDLLEQKTSSSPKSGRTMKQQTAAQRSAPIQDGRYAITEQEYQEVILNAFAEGLDGPLTSFPSKEKRRIIILRHLISRFKTNKRYTEKEINSVLQEAYADHVTLRRYMIEYGLMEREPDGSAYWVKEGVKQMSKEKRKELVLAYKEMKKPMGIYRLRNTANGKIFIGSSLNLEGRWNRHQFELNMNMERIADLQNDWKQFGEQQFVFEVLEQLEQRNEGYQDIPDELEKLEAKWIEQLQPFGEAGYNMKK